MGKIKIIAMTLVIVMAFQTSAYATGTVTNKENQIKENQETIKELQEDKSEVAGEKSVLNAELQGIIAEQTALTKEADKIKSEIRAKEAEINLTNKKITDLTAKIAETEAEIERKLAEIAETEAALAAKKEMLDARIRASYMNSSFGDVIFALVESESLLEFTDRLTMINRLVEKDNEIIEAVKLLMEELRLKQEELEETKRQFLASKEELESEKIKLETEKKALEAEKKKYSEKLAALRDIEYSKNQALSRLSAEEKAIASEIGDIIEENAALEKEIQKLIRESSSSSNAPASNNNAAQAPSAEYIKPVSGRISSPYGWRIHPILGYSKFHTGVDFAAASGTAVKAVKGGVVILAKYNSSYGNYIIIDHGNGVSSLYAHLKGFNTSLGSRVSQGQTIGFVGSTGMSTGPHLHFEIRVNGEHVNPANYI
ncbi:murein hydrolase activator EnvC family protein [Youngiibacter multivorans]|uniref:Murein DD-endopeptidase MepM/ murein hydrolase activator NlpD n=1 Tax=Youngiibacter multivorans TaxID=937251 RepID=A0ABS4G0Q3_9CLOT|nr:M23 family metallopeptidase [Youngiibacter multivorans]MBP1918130.1 murein DD-endopeptidase MepM/ murein hydrolase activator NlpD [Youngiibacter multivorans]